MRVERGGKYLSDPIIPVAYVSRNTIRRDPHRPLWKRFMAFIVSIWW